MAPGVWIALAIAALAPQGQQPAPTDPHVHLRVGVYTYTAEGSLAGSASGTADERGDAANIVWVAMGATSCGTGAGMLPSRPDATAWKWTGRILGQNKSGYLVQVNLERAAGATNDWPPRTVNAIVAIGGSAVLDQIPATTGPCSGRIARLEARVELAAPPSAPVVRGTAGAAAAGPSGAVGKAPHGGASAASGSAAAGPAAADPRAAVAEGTGNGEATAMMSALARLYARKPTSAADLVDIPTPVDHIRIARPDGVVADDAVPVELRNLPAASYDAEVWLISTGPDGRSQTLFRTGHLDATGRIFTFPQVRIKTSTGVVRSVDVAVNLRPMAIPEGALVLRAAIGRFVENSGWGSMDKALPMPDRGDVVSFEMPNGPWREGPRNAIHDDAMSVRVRITPSRGPGK